MSAPRFTIALVLLCLLLVPARAFAAWPHDPNNGNLPISTASGDQSWPSILADGSGGAFIAWHGTLANDIYVQRVNAAGTPLWTSGGVLVCGAGGGQAFPFMALDGTGGVLVAWYDFRSGNGDIYAQKVDKFGVTQWTTNGVAVCTAAGDQLNVQVAADGEGGLLLAWQDARGGAGTDIYAQRFTGGGFPQWTANGVLVCASPNDQTTPQIVGDGTGGCFVVWQDQRAGVGLFDVWGQRLNSVGAPQWAANGLTLCGAAGHQITPRIVADGLGGVITTWYDQRLGPPSDIYAQRTTAAGTMLWNGNGVPICTAANEQNGTAITTDGAGGAIIAWSDYRNGGTQDVYAQRINVSGTTMWTANGVPLSTFTLPQTSVAIASDGAQGAVVSWQDFRGFSTDVYAQRVSATGAALWTTDGVAVCTAYGTQQGIGVVSDGAGGAILAWMDYRSGIDADVYAQRVERFGQLGNPEPTIAGVRDVLNDQGGKVRLSWNASYLDGDPWNLVSSYWIWRQAPGDVAAAALRSGARLESEGATPATAASGLWKSTVDAGQVYYWEYLGSQPAQGFPAYSYVASTTGDSLDGSNPHTYFMVEAKSSGAAYWASAPDSGYSVDNLAPAAPSPFTAQYDAGSASLHWGASPEADFLEYRLYRGSSASFVPGPGNLVTAQPDTGYVDAAGAPYYYKLAAVDVHGNVSPFVTVQTQGTVGVPDATVPERAWLAGARPNPVTAGADLRFALPTAAPVTLALFDAGGRLVRMLASGVQPAGERVVRWDGRDDGGARVSAGVYYLRLQTGATTLTRTIAVVH